MSLLTSCMLLIENKNPKNQSTPSQHHFSINRLTMNTFKLFSFSAIVTVLMLALLTTPATSSEISDDIKSLYEKTVHSVERNIGHLYDGVSQKVKDVVKKIADIAEKSPNRRKIVDHFVDVVARVHDALLNFAAVPL